MNSLQPIEIPNSCAQTTHSATGYGSIQAAEPPLFIGARQTYSAALTFADAIPTGYSTPTPEPTPIPRTEPTPIPTLEPTATAILPVTDDTAVACIPPIAIAVGLVLLALSGGLLLLSACRVRANG